VVVGATFLPGLHDVWQRFASTALESSPPVYGHPSRPGRASATGGRFGFSSMDLNDTGERAKLLRIA